MIKEPRYIAQGPGGYYATPGQYVTPAPRSYKDAAHAQLANPRGRLYVATLDEENDRLVIEAGYDSYPVTLQETRVPGVGAQAEGRLVLRDLGPRTGTPHRWATHFQNDQLGGYHGGNYYDDFGEAVRGFAEKSAEELRRAALRLAALADA